MRRAALLIVAFALLTSCTTAVPGNPAVAPFPSPGPRPRELRLDGRDPCSLLTPAQATALGLNNNTRDRTKVGVPVPGPACGIDGSKPRSVIAQLILGVGTSLADLTKPGALSDDLIPIDVGGFSAVLARPHNVHLCFADVDVAKGQVLDVLFGDGGQDPPIVQDQLCRDVVTLAAQATETLRAS